MVTSNRDDFSWIVHVRFIELRPVLLILIGSVNHVAQVQEKRGRASWLAHVEIHLHRLGNVTLGRIGTAPGVAYGVKPDGPRIFNVLAPLRADDVCQGHTRRSRRRRYRFKVSLDVVDKPRPNPRYRLPCRNRLARVERMGKSKWLTASSGTTSLCALFHLWLSFSQAQRAFSPFERRCEGTTVSKLRPRIQRKLLKQLAVALS